MQEKSSLAVQIKEEWNNSKLVAWVLVLAFAGLTLLAVYHPQSPGVSIGILALVAGIMSLRGEMHVLEKCAWILILIILTVLEVHAIGVSDKHNESIRDAQNKEFDAIVKKLTDSDEKNKSRFDLTMSGVDTVYDKTKLAAETATKAVNTMTGGDSRPYLYPEEPIAGPDGVMRFRLLPRLKGRYALRDVDYDVYSALRGSLPRDHLDTLYPGASYRSLVVHQLTVPSQADEELFQIMIIASNGPYYELLRIRKVNGRWLHALRLQKLGPPTPTIYLEDIQPGFGDVDWTKP